MWHARGTGARPGAGGRGGDPPDRRLRPRVARNSVASSSSRTCTIGVCQGCGRTSIEFDRATGTPVHLRLRELLTRSSGELAVTEPVIAEVAIGARSDEREMSLRRLLGRCELLSFDAVADFDGAVSIYRRCRSAGITQRGLLDCMIASVALRHRAIVLAQDADLARISDVVPLRLDDASLRTPLPGR